MYVDKTPKLIYCVYKSPTGNNKDFIAHLSNIVDKEKNTDSGYSIIIDDINIDIIGNMTYEHNVTLEKQFLLLIAI